MVIAVLSDIHGNYSGIDKIPEELIKADYVFIAGDITHFGSEDDADQVISLIEKYNTSIFAVPGNCDNPGVGRYLEAKGYSIDRKHLIIPGTDISLLGLGGSLPAPVSTPNTYSEDYYNSYLETAGYADILMSHQPPYKTQADMVMKIKHAGSKSIKKYIEEKSPVLCICGHIHESSGKSMQGKTLIVNPGPFKEGYYALIKIDSGSAADAVIKNYIRVMT